MNNEYQGEPLERAPNERTHAERPSDASLVEAFRMFVENGRGHNGTTFAIESCARELDAAKPAQGSDRATCEGPIVPEMIREAEGHLPLDMPKNNAYPRWQAMADFLNRAIANPNEPCPCCNVTPAGDVLDHLPSLPSAAQAPERRAVTDEDVRYRVAVMVEAFGYPFNDDGPEAAFASESVPRRMLHAYRALESLAGMPAAQPAKDAAAEPVAIVLADLFDPTRLPARREDGCVWHPDVLLRCLYDGDPEDEAPISKDSLASLGWEERLVQFDGDYEEGIAWEPESPGLEWRLACISDTEDGWCAWFMRRLHPASAASGADARLADTQRAIIEAAEARGYERAKAESGADSSQQVALDARDAGGDRYCWSHDEEEYHGDFDTREAALAEATAELEVDGEPGDTRAVWTGVQRGAMYFLRQRAEQVGCDFAERMDEHLCDEIASDDPIVGVTDPGAFGSALLDLLERHATFGRWAVAEVQEHAVVVPDDALAAQQRKGG